jgi:hypothetical protein
LIGFGSLLGALSTLSILVIIYILARLSERFGSVVKMRPRYKYYYGALILLSIGWIAQLLVLTTPLTPSTFQSWFNSDWFVLLAYYLPIATGTTIGLVITWSYWGWLVTERNG